MNSFGYVSGQLVLCDHVHSNLAAHSQRDVELCSAEWRALLRGDAHRPHTKSIHAWHWRHRGQHTRVHTRAHLFTACHDLNSNRDNQRHSIFFIHSRSNSYSIRSRPGADILLDFFWIRTQSLCWEQNKFDKVLLCLHSVFLLHRVDNSNACCQLAARRFSLTSTRRSLVWRQYVPIELRMCSRRPWSATLTSRQRLSTRISPSMRGSACVSTWFVFAWSAAL